MKSVEQFCRDFLERAIEDGLVMPAVGEWEDHDPQARSAGELVGVANMLSAECRESYRAGLEAAVKALEESKPLAWALVEIATDNVHTVLPNDFDRISDWIGEDEKPESYYVVPLYAAAVVKALLEEKA